LRCSPTSLIVSEGYAQINEVYAYEPSRNLSRAKERKLDHVRTKSGTVDRVTEGVSVGVGTALELKGGLNLVRVLREHPLATLVVHKHIDATTIMPTFAGDALKGNACGC